MKLIASALSVVGLVARADELANRDDISARIQSAYGWNYYNRLVQHGCHGANLDIDNRAWAGGYKKVDDVDGTVAKWHHARRCMELPGAECGADIYRKKNLESWKFSFESRIS